MPSIDGANILIMATNRFEESELFGPREILLGRGAKVTLASLDRDEIMATVHDDPGKRITPDLTIAQASAEDYDALLLPGGVGNPDRLRTDEDATRFARAFIDADKPVAAICHAPWVLIDADAVSGRTMTAVKSVRTDLANAGANVVNEEVVVDGHLITSRGPDDLPGSIVGGANA